MNEAHKDYARTLLKKAEIDLLNASILRDSGKGNPEGIGLHVQQAVEKSLKAILAFQNIHYPKTHSIAGLVRLASDNHIEPPDAFAKSDRLRYYSEVRRGHHSKPKGYTHVWYHQRLRLQHLYFLTFCD